MEIKIIIKNKKSEEILSPDRFDIIFTDYIEHFHEKLKDLTYEQLTNNVMSTLLNKFGIKIIHVLPEE